MHIADLLTNRARLTPEREALLEQATRTRYTYAQLNERANRAANYLRDKLGVQAGDRVSILAHNSIVYLDLFYGLAKIGAIFAPLNWRLVANELVYILNDCEARVLLCGPEFVHVLAEMRPQLSIPHLVSVDGAAIAGAHCYEDEIAQASPAEPTRPAGLDGETTHCILYTSGTTGRPKGAMIPHRQVLWNCINTVVSWGLTEQDVSPVFTPMFHAGGLFAFLTPLLYVGGRIVLGKQFDEVETLRTILAEKCTVILGVPTLFQMWLNSPAFAQADFSHVHFFISGGAPCPPSLMNAWREAKGVIFRQGYGLTEVGPNCFSMTDAESAPKTGSVGKPIFHSQMRLVDENGQDVPVGQTGELLIKGPHVCTGYWRNPDATAKALREGWFYTGDMARQDEDGFFTIAGRFKDMIISGGENVYAAEVEAIFVEHPAVSEAALIGEPDEKWGEVGVMAVVRAKGQTIEGDELRQFCRGRLASYKVPKRVVFVDALPYSPYGKVIKAELRKQVLGE
ncbi:MAG: long-chain fatty acid--CoA ligase [Chloroflexi bacterium]|nr:long-chain fatty acid--CoA ligase [Chloroflexota bacterium]